MIDDADDDDNNTLANNDAAAKERGVVKLQLSFGITIVHTY